jgi:uncharacterized protein (UPF0335 family)
MFSKGILEENRLTVCMVVTDNLEKYIERFERIYDDPTHPKENLKQIKHFLRKAENKISQETLKSN